MTCGRASSLRALACALLAVGTGRAQAPTPPPPAISVPFSLNWSAPAECPDEAALRAEVLRLAAEAASGVPGFSAKGSVARVPAGYELELETLYGERHGNRRMQDVSCTELTRAAAVVIALAIRPESAAPEDAAPVPPAGEVAPAKLPPEVQPVPTAPRKSESVRPEPPARQPFDVWLSAAFAGELGTLPGFAPGVMLGAEARTDFLRVGLSAEILPKQRSTPAAPGDPVIVVDYVGADALGCLGMLKQKLAPGGCAGLGMGRLRGESRNAAVPGEGSTFWITPRIGGFLLYRPLPSLSLEAGAHARFAVKKASFNVENYGPVYQTAPVALLLTAGASLRIW